MNTLTTKITALFEDEDTAEAFHALVTELLAAATEVGACRAAFIDTVILRGVAL